MLQLPLVFGVVEVAVRGSDQSIRSNLPKLEATDAEPMSSASWSGVGADQRPVVLIAVTLRSSSSMITRISGNAVIKDRATSAIAFRPTAGVPLLTVSEPSTE